MKSTRLLLLSVLFILLLNEPIITLVDRNELLLGIPVLYLYVMVVWMLLIGLLAYVIHRATPTDDPLSDDD
ncbi:hypothetical protein [Spirosoma rhododendri]|uniref:DUF3311 domain-containing protein n=1 Tax=Spirosoma rhododendri TaxID=2728024 RepID=A0A7L5DMC0_9BACT|nr:hypothetical protein [Spirosoma rhododendri]QJD79624.1 hypothetical protein HH216_15260 [Spirosoma rhododendri]